MKLIIFKIFIAVSYFLMIYINYLANSLPINNRNTGQISSDYPSLFTPSGYAFSIWGIIYVLLGIYAFKTILASSDNFTEQYTYVVMGLFVLTSILNVFWLLSWHYDRIILSTIVMLLFLITNIIIVNKIPATEVLMKTTFSIYAGWIMIAFVANITIMLVKLDIPLFSNNEVLWYSLVITICLAIASLLLIFDKNVVYGLVFIWAFLAIFLKHFAKNGYHLTTSLPVIYTAAIIVMIAGLTIWRFISNGYKFFA
ncbi:tryptophan-rich sensory protein [Mycoplasmatota bacterium WC30]